MRRQLAALAALTVIVLGTPAIALASTITAGSGPPGQVRIVCPPPPGQPVKPVSHVSHVRHVRLRPVHVRRPAPRSRGGLRVPQAWLAAPARPAR